MKIAILDYDAGNIKSVEKAVALLGAEPVITRDFSEIEKADKVILPGVGSFGDAMAQLKKYDLIKAIHDVADSDKPFLGICLGLQLLFEESEESKGVEGLGLLKGKVVKFPTDMPQSDGRFLKVPQIGWNSLKLQNNGRLFADIDQGAYVYFVHSYYLQAEDESIVKAVCEYGIPFHASVEKDNVFACQFHPEKSSKVGLKILSNFIKL